MVVLRSLSHRPIALLWGALVLSAVGSELYTIAIVWLSTGILGPLAGYLVALQAGCSLLFSLTGGALADGWDHRGTMFWSDVIRAVAVLVPPVWSLFAPLTIWVLVPVIVVVASMRPMFDPALQASLPRLATTPQELQSVNGLFDAMRRVARILGPMLAAGLQTVMAPLQFFTLNAATFMASAWAVWSLKRELPRLPAPTMPSATGMWDVLASGFRITWAHRVIRFQFASLGLGAGVWYLGLILGPALHLRQTMPDNVGAYGLVIASYGVGNVLGSFAVGEARLKRPLRLTSFGRLFLGSGFAVMGFAPSLPWMMAGAALSAVGGPMSNIPTTTQIQTDFALADIAKVYRVRMVWEWGGTLVVLALSPTLFQILGAPGAIVLAGITYLGLGATGLWRFGPADEPDYAKGA